MNKKYTWLVITLMVIMMVALVFASCAPSDNGGNNNGGDNNPPLHEHTFADKLSSDETYHWYQATCEHSDQVDGKAEHTFENKICTACGYNSWKSSEGLEFKLSNDGSYYILKSLGDCTEKDVFVAPYHKGLLVKEIASSAFKAKGITSITLHDSIEKIGNQAFWQCTGLSKVDFVGFTESPSMAIDNWATINFDGDGANPLLYTKKLHINGEELVNANIRATEISPRAFASCESLERVSIAASVKHIGEYAFIDCKNLVGIDFNYGAGGDILETVGRYAFADCKLSGNVYLPNSVKEIGAGVFAENPGITNITLPFVGAKVTTEYASQQYPLGYIFGETSYTGATATQQEFYNTSTTTPSFKTYYIPTGLTSVTITGGRIVYGAFSNCTNLTEIHLETVAGGATTIEEKAFYNCEKLEMVVLGKKLTYIGATPFVGCSSLKRLYFLGTAENWESIEKDANWDKDGAGETVAPTVELI